MPLLAHQESHRSEQVTNTSSNHCSGLRHVPPGETGTMTAEARIAKVKEGTDGFTGEGQVIQLEGEA